MQEYSTTAPGLSGAVVFFDQFGNLEFEEKTKRMGKTELDEAPTARRSMRPRFFNKAIGFDEFDSVNLGQLDVPVSKTLENLRFAAARRMDDVMIQGFLGTNYTGEDGMTPVEIPDSNIIKSNYVETGSAVESNLTVAKLRGIVQYFMQNDAWNDDMEAAGDKIVVAVAPSQIVSLLREKEVTSYDFNTIKALQAGTVNDFMGLRFLRTNRLPVVDGKRVNLAFIKSRAQFGIWSDYKTKISVRDDMDETLQIRAKFSCGATRLEEKAFLKILCDETK